MEWLGAERSWLRGSGYWVVAWGCGFGVVALGLWLRGCGCGLTVALAVSPGTMDLALLDAANGLARVDRRTSANRQK